MAAPVRDASWMSMDTPRRYNVRLADWRSLFESRRTALTFAFSALAGAALSMAKQHILRQVSELPQ